MFTQFRSQYPTGGLVSELLQVYEGHYLVRTLVQVGGISLASGMASAPTLELAEDQARIRALALLNIHPSSSPMGGTLTEENRQSKPLKNGSVSRNLEAVPSPSQSTIAPSVVETPVISQTPLVAEVTAQGEDLLEEIVAPAISEPEVSSTWEKPEISPPVVDASSWMPEDLSATEPPLQEDEDDTAYSEPTPDAEETLDFTEISIQINLELKHIGWMQKQENSYLKRIYGKNGRALLSDRELLEFLHYLQAYAQTTVELERLNWSNDQGSEYLEETYGKKSRALLKCDELQGFLSYLQTQPTPNEALF